MKTSVLLTAVFIGGMWLPTAAFSQELIVFPKAGQSQEQMEQDKFACHSWAKDQSGLDPTQPAQMSSADPQQQPQRGLVRGAARGALVGVTVGAIAGDAGKGAAIGAASGGLLGGMRSADQKRGQQQAAEQQAQQQAQAYNQQKDIYNRAYAACLEAKGYTVK